MSSLPALAQFRNVADAVFFATEVPTGSENPTTAPRADPSPILNIMAALVETGRLSAEVVAVLMTWGSRGSPPNPASYFLRSDWKMWKEGLDVLEPALRRKGIVA